MSRAPRASLPNGYFHVSARGVATGQVFRDDVDRSAFVEILSLCERRRPERTCRPVSTG
jgi:hypothetical protein